MRFEVFSSKVKHFPIICLYSKPLQWVDSYCYLRYDMSSSVKHYDFKEIDKRCHALRVRANMLASRFLKVSDDVRKLLFKTYFSIIYCGS